MFRARFSPIFIACDKMPRLPWNLRVVTTPRSPTMGLAKDTQHNTSEVLRLPHKMTKRGVRSAAPATNSSSENNYIESITPATQNDLQHVLKYVEMSQSATRAT